MRWCRSASLTDILSSRRRGDKRWSGKCRARYARVVTEFGPAGPDTTHSTTEKPPSPAGSPRASASRTRLRARIAARSPTAARSSQTRRPSSTSSSRPWRARNSAWLDTASGPRAPAELIERYLRRDVLAPRPLQRRPTALVPDEGPQPLALRPGRQLGGGGHVVEHHEPAGDDPVEDVAHPRRCTDRHRHPSTHLRIGRMISSDVGDRRPGGDDHLDQGRPSAATHTSCQPSSHLVRTGRRPGCRAARWPAPPPSRAARAARRG